MIAFVKPTSPHRDPVFISSIGIVILSLLTFLVDPNQSTLFPICPFFYFTGMYCPGCGSLRSTHSLLHGEFLNALNYNALFVLSVPFVLLFLVTDLWHIKRLQGFYANPAFPRVALLLIVAYWIARNIGLYPFTLLAP